MTVVAPSGDDPAVLRTEVETYFATRPAGGVILEDAERLFDRHRRGDALAFLEWLREYVADRGPLLVSFDADALSASDAKALRAAVVAPRTRSTLEALGNPIRRAVLRRAARGACSFSDAMKAAEIDDSPKLSFHLRKLVDEGLLAHSGEEYRLTPLGQESVRLLESIDAIPPDPTSGSAAAAPHRPS